MEILSSNDSKNFNNPKEFDDPQVIDVPKGISIGSMDFDNPKVYTVDSTVIPPSSMFFMSVYFFDHLLGRL